MDAIRWITSKRLNYRIDAIGQVVEPRDWPVRLHYFVGWCWPRLGIHLCNMVSSAFDKIEQKICLIYSSAPAFWTSLYGLVALEAEVALMTFASVSRYLSLPATPCGISGG